MPSRTLTIASAARYAVQTESYQGRQHLVVPVVALVEGVLHAMNAKKPEFVAAEELTKKPGGWNGRPIFHGHPVNSDGEPLSGNSPDVLEDGCIGTVFNAAVKKQKLTMQAWIDVAAAEQKAPKLLSRVRAGEPIEISVGVFCDTDETVTGEYNGKKYAGAWTNLVADHLALLTEADTGACSIEMGCGVRAAKESSMKGHMYAAWLNDGAETDTLLKTLRDISQDDRDKLPAEDFAGPNKSFPIVEAADVHDAAQSLGRAKGNRAAIKRKIVAIAYRKGDAFVAQLPDDWKRGTDKNASEKKQSMKERFAGFIKSLGLTKAAQDSDEMSDSDLRQKLNDSLMQVEPMLLCVESYYPVTDPAHVVYTVREPNGLFGTDGYGPYPASYPLYDYVMYERAFDLSDAGTITLNDLRIEVEPVMRYEPVEGASPAVTAAKAANAGAGAPCSCHNKQAAPTAATTNTEETDMENEKIAKFLKTATPEQIAALEAFVEKPAPAAVLETPVPAPAAPVAAAAVPAVKAPTFEEILATADPAMRDAVNEGARIGREKKAATIKALKATERAAGFSDAELDGMTQSQLDRLVALAGTNVRAAIDYSVNGPKVAAADSETIDAPEDLAAALKAARGEK